MQRRVLQELSDDWNESVNLNFENCWNEQTHLTESNLLMGDFNSVWILPQHSHYQTQYNWYKNGCSAVTKCTHWITIIFSFQNIRTETEILDWHFMNVNR